MTFVAVIIGLVLVAGPVSAQQGLTKCSIPGGEPCASDRSSPRPQCGIEMTCTDQSIELGYSEGVCFRATCPGIWAVIHQRADQASFRRRIFTYRHYHFAGVWEVKDQGSLEASEVPLRELFLVLPDDLIEFRLADPDCHARIDLRSFGYIKKGDLCELQKWLAYNTYFERPNLGPADPREANRRCAVTSARTGSPPEFCAEGFATRLYEILGRSLVLPFR